MIAAETEYCDVHSSQTIEGWSPVFSLKPFSLYFRCHRLSATMSLAHCRENRAKIPFVEALNYFDSLPPNVQPIQCAKCPLAQQVETNKVQFFNINEVMQGRVLASDKKSPKEISGSINVYNS